MTEEEALELFDRIHREESDRAAAAGGPVSRGQIVDAINGRLDAMGLSREDESTLYGALTERNLRTGRESLGEVIADLKHSRGTSGEHQ
jgi:hypothetical protein